MLLGSVQQRNSGLFLSNNQRDHRVSDVSKMSVSKQFPGVVLRRKVAQTSRDMSGIDESERESSATLTEQNRQRSEARTVSENGYSDNDDGGNDDDNDDARESCYSREGSCLDDDESHHHQSRSVDDVASERGSTEVTSWRRNSTASELESLRVPPPPADIRISSRSRALDSVRSESHRSSEAGSVISKHSMSRFPPMPDFIPPPPPNFIPPPPPNFIPPPPPTTHIASSRAHTVAASRSASYDEDQRVSRYSQNDEDEDDARSVSERYSRNEEDERSISRYSRNEEDGEDERSVSERYSQNEEEEMSVSERYSHNEEEERSVSERYSHNEEDDEASEYHRHSVVSGPNRTSAAQYSERSDRNSEVSRSTERSVNHRQSSRIYSPIPPPPAINPVILRRTSSIHDEQQDPYDAESGGFASPPPPPPPPPVFMSAGLAKVVPNQQRESDHVDVTRPEGVSKFSAAIQAVQLRQTDTADEESNPYSAQTRRSDDNEFDEDGITVANHPVYAKPFAANKPQIAVKPSQISSSNNKPSVSIPATAVTTEGELSLEALPGYQPVADGCPDWKRAMIEKKNAQLLEQALKQLEEEKKWKDVPAWKRNLIDKKKTEEQLLAPPSVGIKPQKPPKPAWLNESSATEDTQL